MADTYTTNLNLTKPEPGAAEDTWGISLNADLDALDAIFSSSGTQINLNPNQINFADNKKAVFGNSSDLQIYHDGLNSHIKDTGTGDLLIEGSDNIWLMQSGGNKVFLNTIDSSAINLYFNNSKKLETTNTGVLVTGSITTDGITTSADINFGDDDKALFGASNDLKIYHSANNQSYIHEVGSGDLNILATNLKLQDAGGSTKVLVNSAGINVTGTTTTDGLTVQTAQGDIKILDSASLIDMQRAATNYIYASNASGSLRLGSGGSLSRLNIANNGDISFYDDTGSTQGFFWDASAESLCLGNTSAGAKFDIRQDSGYAIRAENNLGSYFRVAAGGNTEIGGSLNVSNAGTIINSGVNSGTALTVKGESGNGLKTRYIFESGTNQYNWQLGFSTHASQTFSITPSTAANGTTFSNPVLNINQSGAATFTGNVTLSSTSPLLYLANTTSGTGKTWRFSSASNGKLYITQEGVIDAVTLSHTTGNATFAGTVRTGDGTAAAPGIQVGDNDTGLFQPADNVLGFSAWGTERARIDSSGRLLIGTTDYGLSSSNSTTGINLRPNSASAFARSGGTTLYLNRLSSDGDILALRKDGSTVGSIGTSNGDLTLDAVTNINLDADGGFIVLKDGGVTFGALGLSGGNFLIKPDGVDQDIVFNGNDGGSAITALTLDMSEGGNATFNGTITSTGLTIDNEYTLPSASGSAGQVLKYPATGSQVIWADDDTETTTINNNADNRIITGSGTANTLNAEANFTYDGSRITTTSNSALGTTFTLANTNGGGGREFTFISNSTGNFYIYDDTANTTRFTIDSSGNVLVGKTASDFSVYGLELVQTGVIRSTVGNGHSLLLNRKDSDGEIINLRKDNATVGSLGTFGSDIYIGNNDSGLRFEYAGLNAVTPFDVNSLSASDGATDLGYSNSRFKDLYLSGHLKTGGGGSNSTGEIEFVADSTRARIVGGYQGGGGGYLKFHTDTTGGTDLERARFDSSGRFGLGVSSPSSKLEVKSSGSNADEITLVHSGNTVKIASLGQESSHGSLILRNNGGTNQVRLSAGGNNSYLLNSNFGIGTSSPSHKLTIEGTTSSTTTRVKTTTGNAIYRVSTNNSDFAIIGQGGSNRLDVYDNNGGTTRLSLNSSGRLGLGDTAPQDYLEINGSGKGLGGLTISNSTHNHAALSFARSSTATARIYLNEPDATHTGQLNFQTSNASGGSPNLVTAMVIDENQNVGIGTTSPSAPLHISTTSSSVSRVVSSNSSSTNFGISNTSTGNAQLLLDGSNGDFLGGDYVMLKQNNDLSGELTNVGSNPLLFSTGNTERIRIDSSGNLLVGTTSASIAGANTTGVVLSANAAAQFSRNGGHSLDINRTQAGELVRFRSAGAIVGSIGTNGGTLYISSPYGSDAGLRIGNGFVAPATNSGAANNNAIDLGYSGNAYKKLWVGDIDASGNVGIGASSPDGNLEVVTSTVVSGVSDTVNNVLIGLQASNRPTIVLDTADTTYTNRTWNITNVGAVGSLVIGRHGLDVLNLKNDGKVGIGTSSPARQLTVQNTSNAIMALVGGTTGLAYYTLGDSDDDNYAQIILDNSTNKLQIQNGGGTLIANRGITLDSSENVGIGTSSPSQPLHVDASGGGVVRVTRLGNSASAYGQLEHDGTNTTLTSSAQLIFNSGGSETARLDSQGRLGLGTDSPTVKLEIQENTNSADVKLRLRSFNSSSAGRSTYIAYNPDTRIMGFGEGGDEVNIDQNGSVGIGTASPTFSSANYGGLHIHTGNGTALRLTNATSGQTASDGSELLLDPASADLLIVNRDSGNQRFYTGGSERMRIDSSGNIGIGINNPQERLQVYDSSGTDVLALTTATATANTTGASLLFRNLSSSATGAISKIGIQTGSAIDRGSLVFSTSGSSNSPTERMRITSAGRLGLGTTSPTQKLEVVGGGLGVGNGTIQTVISYNTRAVFGTTSNHDLEIRTNNTERMRIDSSGNVEFAGNVDCLGNSTIQGTLTSEGLFTTENKAQIEGSKSSSTNPIATIKNRHTTNTNGTYLDFVDHNDNFVCSIGTRPQDNTSNSFIIGGSGSYKTGLKFLNYTTYQAIYPATADGATTDNTIDLGYSSGRFQDIYATNGTIQTSDKNEKQDIQALTEAEQRVATACKGLIRRFRWQDAVEKKDNNPDSDLTARYHFGVMAQDLQDAFEAEGLDAGDYGMFISSTWTDDDGNEQTRLGVRYNELLAFIITTL